ncbi:MAG: acyltransferase family protein [Deltaproteobacteria bacterium]|nr:acyltransferase family protein [Deltaproteobacteria bacterium]
MKYSIEELIAHYDRLSPDERERVRLEILHKSREDDRLRRKMIELEEPGPATPKHEFDPLSEDLAKYARDLKDMLLAYIPKDRYRHGDEDRLTLVRKETLHAMEPLEWVLKQYFRYEVIGIENMPKHGRAMIISNHGLLPLDGWFLFYEILRHTGRWARGLTDWRIYQFPYLRQFFMDMGMVVGSHENGDRLLQNEELIFIMPGGAKEAWKSSHYRYRLLWKGRLGFIRMALRNRCPIIPSANVGTDDTYRIFFDGYTTAYKLFGTKKALLPISLPIGLGLLPLPAKMTQYVGEPIRLPYPPEAADDNAVVEECQEMVKSAVNDLIDRGLRERDERKLSLLGGGKSTPSRE